MLLPCVFIMMNCSFKWCHCANPRATAIASSQHDHADVCSAAIVLALYAHGCNVGNPAVGTRASRLSRRCGFVVGPRPRPVPECKIIIIGKKGYTRSPRM